MNLSSHTQVYLVGAGPGDPELLTLKALNALKKADVVFYDALLNPKLLEFAPHAKHIFVGKRANAHSMPQERIEELMIEYAQSGAIVLRLKAGDPFVFGRGGEEKRSIEKAGIAVQVIPGVSSALAAPSSAGIPVTHRGIASSMVLLTGHDPQIFEGLLMRQKPQESTLVILMGFKQRQRIAQVLLDHNWPQNTPVALIAGATHRGEHVWRGELWQLGAESFESLGHPTTLVIGNVVKLSAAESYPESEHSYHEAQHP